MFSLVERDGTVRSMHVADVTTANLQPILASQVDDQSKLYTDDPDQYKRFIATSEEVEADVDPEALPRSLRKIAPLPRVVHSGGA